MREGRRVYTCPWLQGKSSDGRDAGGSELWFLIAPGMEDMGVYEVKAAGTEELKVPSCWRAGSQEENLISLLRSRASAGRLRPG